MVVTFWGFEQRCDKEVLYKNYTIKSNNFYLCFSDDFLIKSELDNLIPLSKLFF